MEDEVESHVLEEIQSNHIPLEIPDSRKGIVRKRENSSPPQVVKKIKTNAGDSIQVISNNESKVEERKYQKEVASFAIYAEQQEEKRRIEKLKKRALNSNYIAPNNANIWTVNKGNIESDDWPMEEYPFDLGYLTMELDDDEVPDLISKDQKQQIIIKGSKKRKKKKSRPKKNARF
jgi:hypothetical protein